MYRPVKVANDTWWIGVNDHETELFEAMWPLPRGVCYNAYIVAGEKVALVETVKRGFWSQYLDNIAQLLDNGRQVDYLVINHMEPDHSGSIKSLLARYPDITIVGNKKTMEFLDGFYGIVDRTMVVGDGDELDLGNHTLTFKLTPMVHWPETMMTYDKMTGVLFSGDGFGGFGSLEGGMFDDEVSLDYYLEEIRRYYSNIIGKFSKMVQNAIAKLQDLDVRVIAPAHGLVWCSSPKTVIKLYDQWSRHEAEEGIVVVYGSMYSHTQKMAEAVARACSQEGIKNIRLHDVARTHISYIINDIWRFKGLAMGCCTYDLGIFPPMDNLLRLLEGKKLTNRVMGIFGSYSWSGGAVKGLKEFWEKTGWPLAEPVVEVRCAPPKEQLEQCAEMGRALARAVQG